MGSETTTAKTTGRFWTRGELTAFVDTHALAWELTTAVLTAVYVVLAFLQDQGSSGPIAVVVLVLAGLFAVEFFARLYDSPSRIAYFRKHWLDIVTCIPVAGWFRALRLLRLLAFLRLGAAVRAFGVGAAASERLYGGSIPWVVAPTLVLVWVGASYGYYELEAGVNPHIQNFTDALYFAFVTASTVGYGDVTPVTPAGKVLTGALIFVGIGLLGFASAQVTTKLLPQQNSLADLKAAVDHQSRMVQQLALRVEAMGAMLEQTQRTGSHDRDATYQPSRVE